MTTPHGVALVTGASKGGTGTTIAVRLAAEGFAVALVARNDAGLTATAERSGSWAEARSSCPATWLTPTAGGRPW